LSFRHGNWWIIKGLGESGAGSNVLIFGSKMEVDEEDVRRANRCWVGEKFVAAAARRCRNSIPDMLRVLLILPPTE